MLNLGKRPGFTTRNKHYVTLCCDLFPIQACDRLEIQSVLVA